MEVCDVHNQIAGDLGEIKGRQGLVLEGQKKIFEKLDMIVATGAEAKVQAAIERTKMKPIYWVFTIVGASMVTAIVTTFVHHLFIK